MKDKACIVGVGATGFCRGEGSGKSLHGLQLEAALAALADAGLRGKQGKEDVQVGAAQFGTLFEQAIATPYVAS